MVRLLQDETLRMQAMRQLLFQSHNGAIAAKISPYYFETLEGFQSHNGAIAALPPLNFKSV